MRRATLSRSLGVSFAALLGLLVFDFRATLNVQSSLSSYSIPGFLPSDEGLIPTNWGLQNGDKLGVYQVETEGENTFLRAEQGPDSSVRIGTKGGFRLQDFPILTWQWRVRQIPEGAREDEKSFNDSAAAVYVVFEQGFLEPVPKVLKYVWSSTLAKGTEVDSPSSHKVKVLVLESGSPEDENWVTEKVNVREDYRRLFGKEPTRVQYLALMTDADDTKSFSAADYDEFRALRTVD